MYKVAIAGCGTSLELYEGIDKKNSLYMVSSVSDPIAERRIAANNKWSIENNFDQSDEMFEAIKPDIALIVTPPSNRLPIIEEATMRKANILVQKPLCRTIEESRKIIDICGYNGVSLRVSFYRRYVPAFLAAKKLIENLGDPINLRGKWTSSSGLKPRTTKKWKEAVTTYGGVLVDLGSHVIDISRWWMGEIEDGLLNMHILQGELDNATSFILRHKNGSSTNFYLSNYEYQGAEFYEFTGKEGGFLLEKTRDGYPGDWRLTDWRYGNQNPMITEFPAPEKNPFIDELEDFIKDIDKGEFSIDKNRQGQEVLRITTMLYMSASGISKCALDDFPLEDFIKHCNKKPPKSFYCIRG